MKDRLPFFIPLSKVAPYRVKRPIIVLIILLVSLALWRLRYNQDLQNPGKALNGPSSNHTSKIAKVSVAINTLNSIIVADALRSHQVQNTLHGYQHFIGTRAVVTEEEDQRGRPSGVWTKPAYILSLLLAEMQKPPEERLEWLFWFDADTIILNPHTRLETFLPPDDPTLNNIHLLLTKNWDGINNGVFPIRVHPWSVSLFSAYVAYPTLYPDEHLAFRDQTALWNLLNLVPFKDNYSIVPQRWFNSFPFNKAFDKNGSWIYATPMTPERFDSGDIVEDTQPWKVLKGDMVVHFAGAKDRMSWMQPWIERAEMYLPEWSNSSYQQKRDEEAKAYWVEERLNIKRRQEEERSRQEEEREKEEERRQEEERNRRMSSGDERRSA